jgi:hypothetical protein
VQEAKAHHQNLAPQLDALYEQARTPNAIRWAHDQRIGGRIPEGVMQVAEQWAGQPIDWQIAQHQAERATAQDFARTMQSVADSGVPVTLMTSHGTYHVPAGKPSEERGGRAD